MFSRRSFATLCASVLSAFALGQSPGPAASVAPYSFGSASGTWELPHPAQNGYVDGFLYELTPAPTPAPAFHLAAALVEAPVMCPACVAGSIQGTLDDGLGSGPDYLVLGHYYGTSFDGRGDFSALIYRPMSAAPVGCISGRFSNPPLLPVLGQFDGRWLLRR